MAFLLAWIQILNKKSKTSFGLLRQMECVLWISNSNEFLGILIYWNGIDRGFSCLS